MEFKKPATANKSMQTCDVCKLRHQKCSGGRPSCSHCQLRNLQCVYSTIPAHKVDRSVVKRRDSVIDPQQQQQQQQQQQPEPVPPTQNAPGPPPLSVREAITRTGADRQQSKSKSKKEETNIENRPAAANVVRAPRSAVTASLQYLVGAIRLILLGEEESEDLSRLRSSTQLDLLDATNVWKRRDSTSVHLVSREELPPKDFAQTLLSGFLDGPNKLIYICDPAESQNQLDQLYNVQTPIKDQTMASIYLQLSVGAQITDGISEQVCDAWYESGRAKLETAMENDQECWLWVLQAMLLTCLHLIVAKPSKCYITLGAAIRIAQTYHIDLPYEASSGLTPDDYTKWRQVWLSTVFMDAWFSAALGRLPQITVLTSQDPFIRDLKCETTNEAYLVQTNLARLGVIISRMLGDIHGRQRVDVSVYDQYISVLHNWISALPPVLRFHTDHQDIIQNSHISVGDRSAMFQLEITYLGSMMLLTRPLLLHCAAVQKQHPDRPLPPKVQSQAQTCVDTAIQVGHSCSSMMSRGLLTRRSWLTIYFAFNASLLIMLHQSRQQHRSSSPSAMSTSPNMMKAESGLLLCFSVLQYCAQQDSLAQHYLNIARAFHSVLHGDTEIVKETPQDSPTFPMEQEPDHSGQGEFDFFNAAMAGMEGQGMEGTMFSEGHGNRHIKNSMTATATADAHHNHIMTPPPTSASHSNSGPSTDIPSTYSGSTDALNSAGPSSDSLASANALSMPSSEMFSPAGLRDHVGQSAHQDDVLHDDSMFRDEGLMDMELNGALTDLQDNLNIENWFISPHNVFG